MLRARRVRHGSESGEQQRELKNPRLLRPVARPDDIRERLERGQHEGQRGPWQSVPFHPNHFAAVRLNGPKAAGKSIDLDVDFTDLKKQYGLMVENAVLNHGKPLAQPDATLTMSKAKLDAIQLKELTVEQAITKGDLKIEGKREAFAELMGLLDTFPFWFNIVTPRSEDRV